MNKQLKSFIINILRKSTFKWKPRREAYNAAKEQVGTFSTGRPKYEYRCRSCGELFKAKDVQVDHVDPVVPISGYKSGLEFDLNEYVERMFCEADHMQVICTQCHDKKTAMENAERKKNKVKKS